ncbi:MAG: hypothetical protein K9G62_06205 [Alphaproteobacteria bacterium]|nr:hypothetical protein [Alphaproteobacteria bacterium]
MPVTLVVMGLVAAWLFLKSPAEENPSIQVSTKIPVPEAQAGGSSGAVSASIETEKSTDKPWRLGQIFRGWGKEEDPVSGQKLGEYSLVPEKEHNLWIDKFGGGSQETPPELKAVLDNAPDIKEYLDGKKVVVVCGGKQVSVPINKGTFAVGAGFKTEAKLEEETITYTFTRSAKGAPKGREPDYKGTCVMSAKGEILEFSAK